ncbi:MAG: FAD-binding and (Fe-S)-binding domain-containing protein [Pseudomonadota bacterium]
MLPRIADITPAQSRYQGFVAALKTGGFKGDLQLDYANRVVLATDNSIYQILPQGVLYPAGTEDLVLIARLSNDERFHDIVLSPRGGGTGTNGQSLTDGLIVDLSRHMNRILEINAEERWVRVQTGVVKDQLNVALESHGLFFAPELSTSNRATVGGMINTDACGQGSHRYGKTRDHVLELTSVFLDGTVWISGPMDNSDLADINLRADRVGAAHRVVERIANDNAALIEARFPKLNRCLTGYDLAHIRDADGRFNLNSVLCGSEGTLAFFAEAKLKLEPMLRYAALINVKYGSFEDTLRDTQELMRMEPASIEAVDSIVLNLAMKDIVWDSVHDFFPQQAGEVIQGINLVEFTGNDEDEVKRQVQRLAGYLDTVSGDPGRNVGYTIAYGPDQVKRVWGMRKKAVGLLGNVEGERRPVPFVEDTAVPPEHLADYIMEFRAVLDRENLSYGMFGHVDAGVLHVRPALDMKDPDQEKLVRKISDEVEQLTRKYHGLLWGEHGKGVRSEYSPQFFGPLYPCLQEIKAACDPRNQLNPGKICTPAGSSAVLMKIDGVPTRGQHDRQIPVRIREAFGGAMHCNGNGACFNFDPSDAMCPSWKGTRERVHSPKGRASLIREWLRLLAERGADPAIEARKLHERSFVGGLLRRLRNSRAKRRGEYDFSHEVHAAMAGCLACKACSTQCPVRVSVPDFRSQFLELYYGRYMRPARDYVIGSLEASLPLLRRFARGYNRVMRNHAVQAFMRKKIGLADSPQLTGIDLGSRLKERHIAIATPAAMERLTPAQREKAVIIVQDAFTSYFESQLVLDVAELLQRLGFVPLVAPFRPNGKPLHVHGFLKAYARTAQRNAAMLIDLERYGAPLVGIDPSMTLCFRFEYVKTLGKHQAPKVELLQEWLARKAEHLMSLGKGLARNEFVLLPHCTEKTNAVTSIRDWQTVFTALGQSLLTVDVGCCGMAGTYGHEVANLVTSKKIYELSWSEIVSTERYADRLVVTGYSCRSQVKRLSGSNLQHPAQVLLAAVQRQLTLGTILPGRQSAVAQRFYASGCPC